MTLGNFITDIRGILRDPTVQGHTPHWSDTEILRAVCDGFRRLWAVRPESRYTGAGVRLEDVVFPADDGLSSFNVTLDPRWTLGIVYFAVARCWEKDVTDTVTMQMADGYFKKADAVFAS